MSRRLNCLINDKPKTAVENAEGTLILCKHKLTVASCGGGNFCLKERSVAINTAIILAL